MPTADFVLPQPELRTRRISGSTEWLITLPVVILITVVSTIAMLVCASPELWYDEADYSNNIVHGWRYLWSEFLYPRHWHGPLSIYLAKLGHTVLPASFGPIEFRLRFFDALVASLGIGLMYWMLRSCFGASRSAALVGPGLLVFSVCRLEETDVIGPHSLVLACTLAMLGLGYKWRDRPGWQSALALGAILGFGGLAMTYVIPVALCWAVAVALAGRNWFVWKNSEIRITQWLLPMAMVAGLILLAFWPPSVIHHQLYSDFKFFVKYPHHPTLVNGKIYEITPLWAVIWWLAYLDSPILLVSVAVLSIAAWRIVRTRCLPAKELYLGIWIAFLLGTAITAHIAGARNLLQLIGVLCFAAGALFDDLFGYARGSIRPIAAAAILAIACLNLIHLATDSNYIPYPATAGYREFLRQNPNRIAEHAKAIVYGLPVLHLYAREDHESVAWDAEEAIWTTKTWPKIGADVKYVLMPTLYDRFPPEQPMRAIVADHWNKVWTYKMDRVWDLDLFENPSFGTR